MNLADRLREIVWKMQQQHMTKNDVQRVIEALSYSPPMRDPKRKLDSMVSVSPIITGLRGNTKQPIHAEGRADGEGQGTAVWQIGGAVTGQ